MRRFWLLIAMAASGAALAEGGDEGLVEKDDGSAWHFRVGPVMAPRVRARVRAPRRVVPHVSPQMPGGMGSNSSGTSGNAPADPSAGYAERQYADGFVRPDEGTEDPDSMISGLTWDWGANNVGAQYSGGKMEFHTGMTRWDESVSTSSRSFSSGGGGSGHESDQDILLGVEAMGGWTFFDDQMFDAAVDAGFRFYGTGNLKTGSGYNYGTRVTTTKTRNEYRFVDSYDASGWTDVPSGSYTGTPGGPGRIIGATPTRREELMGSTSLQSSETYSYRYRSHTKLDYRIWDLRLGPTLGWKATDWLAIRGGIYGLLGLVDARLRTSTDMTGGKSSAKSSSCDAVFGMAAGLSAQINLTDNLFLMGGAEYDWWSDTVGLRAGGADARIELSDFTVSLAIGVEF